MDQRVIKPLGMTNTIADFSDSLISGRARWYTEDSLGHTINAPFVDNSYKWAGGGFLSTTEDLLKFGNAMLSNTLLKPGTTAMMFTSQKLDDGKETRYGIGWFVRKDGKDRLVITHSGGSMGGTANLLLYPKEGLVIALLVNSDQRFIHHAWEIADLFLQMH
jgi:CubicO group peptidase (beta-lactamase class C family)